MRDIYVFLLLLLFCTTVAYIGGHYDGKRAADRYYAEHPVTLIQPLKLRAPEPVASIEEPNAASTTICSQCVSPPTRFRTVVPGQISIEEPSK